MPGSVMDELSPSHPVETTVYRHVLYALVAMDLLLIGLYVVLSVMARANWLIQEVPGRFDISEDRGLPESFNYAKWFVIVTCLAATFRRTRVPLFASLATIFLLVLLDDSLGIHEQVGDRLAYLTGWDQLGELIAFGVLGMISLAILVPGLSNLPRAVWPQAVRFIGVLLGLVLCGVVIDFAHASIAWLGLPMARLSDRVRRPRRGRRRDAPRLPRHRVRGRCVALGGARLPGRAGQRLTSHPHRREANVAQNTPHTCVSTLRLRPPVHAPRHAAYKPGLSRPTAGRGEPGVLDDQRARWAALRADQNVIDHAAARLRHETAQDQYRGLRDPQVAFGLASILDELSRHLRDLDDPLRAQTLDCCRSVLGHPHVQRLAVPAERLARRPVWPDGGTLEMRKVIRPTSGRTAAPPRRRSLRYRRRFLTSLGRH